MTPERRQSQKPYPGADRRLRADRRRPPGYPEQGHVNAEEPRTEQDHHELYEEDGPDPRIPK